MKYRMEDGTILNTDKAAKSWDEATRWDGRNNISVATGSQWTHQTLYQSRRGRYYVEHYSQWEGSTPHAEWVSEHEAARWLLMCDHETPKKLAHLVDEIEE